MKYVLVTGASSGIGQALAVDLQKAGYHVLAGIRQASDGERLLALTKTVFPELSTVRLTPVIMDITDQESIEAAFDRINKITPAGLYGLVNNAGIAVSGALELVENENIAAQFSVNVVGTFKVIKRFLPLLKKARGRIVTIGSISGLFSPPGLSVYAASKYAIEGMSDALRVELKPFGVQVSVIEPGKIDTPLWQKSADAEAAAHRQIREGERQGEGGDVLADYRDLIAFYRNYVDTEQGSPLSWVSAAVQDALSNPTPRPRYIVGRAAKLRVLLNYLPTRIRDALVYRSVYRKSKGNNR